MKKLKKYWYVFRSAITGRFIHKKEAEDNPNTSIKEKVGKVKTTKN